MTGLEIALWVIGGVVVLIGGALTLFVTVAVPVIGWVISRIFGQVDSLKSDVTELKVGHGELTKWSASQNGAIHRVEADLKEARSESKESFRKVFDLLEDRKRKPR